MAEAYATLVSRGKLVKDPIQEQLVHRLANLQLTLLERRNTTSRSGYDEPVRGLYIHGGVGTGKTRLVDLFNETLPSDYRRRRTHFHEFMHDVHARLHRLRSSEGPITGSMLDRVLERQRLREASSLVDPLVTIGRQVVAETPLLVFDEFQVSDIADAMILKRLFHAIWTPTSDSHGSSGGGDGVLVATSNRRPRDLYENGLNRPLFLPFVDELERRCDVFSVEGKQDYRMRSTSAGERVETFFNDRSLWEKALEAELAGRPFEGRDIAVSMGRTLKDVPITSTEPVIARTTFAKLFQANLGSTDYQALCSAAQVIYLDGVRPLKADELDYTRRFITFLDIAYEKRVRVVCMSECPLADLFAALLPGGRHQGGAMAKAIAEVSVRGEGGASSSMSSTYIGEAEWSATGLPASLASGGAGETDVRFAVGRAISRLFEMSSPAYLDR